LIEGGVMKGSRLAWQVFAVLLFGATLSVSPVEAETLSFQKAIELAGAHAPNVGVALADQMRAHSSYLEARNAYVPALTVGSGLGVSWGFPLTLEGSAPAVFNVNTQSAMLNFAQREFVRAARTELSATANNTDDQRNQAVLDAAVSFAQLNASLSKLKVLQDQATQAQRAEYITQQRVNEGVDSKAELTRAMLNSARTRLRVADIQGMVDVLKQHLGQLTGLRAENIDIDSESMPKIPEPNADEDAVAKALASSSAVKLADEHARSKAQQARGEHRALWPSIDFAGQYALLSRYNNYDEFYKKFERNNATVGVAIRFPFLNSVQRAHAEAADAETLRAKAEADGARNQVASQTLKLQRSLQQLAAARDVTRLEWELAQNDLDAVTTKLQAGSANLRDQENARIQVNDKYAAYLDATFEYDRARLQLMGQTGELRNWAFPPK
jgi:outer membrane protein